MSAECKSLPFIEDLAFNYAVHSRDVSLFRKVATGDAESNMNAMIEQSKRKRLADKKMKSDVKGNAHGWDFSVLIKETDSLINKILGVIMKASGHDFERRIEDAEWDDEIFSATTADHFSHGLTQSDVDRLRVSFGAINLTVITLHNALINVSPLVAVDRKQINPSPLTSIWVNLSLLKFIKRSIESAKEENVAFYQCFILDTRDEIEKLVVLYPRTTQTNVFSDTVKSLKTECEAMWAKIRFQGQTINQGIPFDATETVRNTLKQILTIFGPMLVVRIVFSLPAAKRGCFSKLISDPKIIDRTIRTVAHLAQIASFSWVSVNTALRFLSNGCTGVIEINDYKQTTHEERLVEAARLTATKTVDSNVRFPFFSTFAHAIFWDGVEGCFRNYLSPDANPVDMFDWMLPLVESQKYLQHRGSNVERQLEFIQHLYGTREADGISVLFRMLIAAESQCPLQVSSEDPEFSRKTICLLRDEVKDHVPLMPSSIRSRWSREHIVFPMQTLPVLLKWNNEARMSRFKSRRREVKIIRLCYAWLVCFFSPKSVRSVLCRDLLDALQYLSRTTHASSLSVHSEYASITRLASGENINDNEERGRGEEEEEEEEEEVQRSVNYADEHELMTDW